MTPKVSVIIPVYNVAKYIEKCLDSVLGQTLSSIEVICIDDGSTDASPHILDQYAIQDDRVSVIHQPNKGPSAARNAGLEAARGEYLFFLDGDDSLTTQTALEMVWDVASEKQLDMLFFEACMSYESESLRAAATEPPDFYQYHQSYPEAVDGQTLYLLLEKYGEYHSANCLYLLRRELVEAYHLRFPEGFFHEDEFFTLAALSLAQRASCVRVCVYDRLWREGSTMSRKNPFDRIRGNLLASRAMLAFARERLQTAKPEFLRRYKHHARAINLRGYRQYMNLSDDERREFLNAIDVQERPTIERQLRMGRRSQRKQQLRSTIKRIMPEKLLMRLRSR